MRNPLLNLSSGSQDFTCLEFKCAFISTFLQICPQSLMFIKISKLNSGFFLSWELLDLRKLRCFLLSPPTVKPGLFEIYIGFSSIFHSIVTLCLLQLSPFDPRFLSITRPSIRQSTISTTWGHVLLPSY